jgi:Cu-processing system permease protein
VSTVAPSGAPGTGGAGTGGAAGGTVSAVRIVAAHALRESLRRRVFAVVLLLTALFVALYALACSQVFSHLDFAGEGTLDARGLATVTLLGLGMFATLFLGTVLAVFLTLGAVRGDAEQGLLQPLVVRPVGRRAFLLARFLAAAAVCVGYVVVLFAVCLLIVKLTGHRWPDRVAGPVLVLAGGVVVMTALSLLGSVFLSTTANGIAVFMAFGAGLVGGLLQTIADALASGTLSTIARIVSLALPFEALYQGGLHDLAADATGVAGAVVQLGPFGASRAAGATTWLVTLAWLLAAAAIAVRGFERRDL